MLIESITPYNTQIITQCQTDSILQFFWNTHPLMKQPSQAPVKNRIRQQIRTYIRVFPSSGVEPILDNEYQILDGNTFLHKSVNSNSNSNGNNKYTMYPFNYIFNQQFENSKQLEHMNIVDDCLEGKNQIIIAEMHREFMTHFMLGTAEDPGLVIELFSQLFSQTLYHTKHMPAARREQNISISIFSTEENSNKFIDLVLGQRFIFYSKKDMDEHKQFHSKEIVEMREFLVLLKIATLHYKQCCHEGDPIVFRITVDSYDEVRDCNFSTVVHLVLCESGSKIGLDLGRKVELAAKSSHLRGEDHGSLANYMERFMRKSKIIYILGIPYRKSVMEASVNMFNWLGQLRNYHTEVEISYVHEKWEQKIQKLNDFLMPSFKGSSHNFTHKDIGHANHLLEKLCQFLHEAQTKWKIYWQTFSEILRNQREFYERQRFPISLEILQFNIKSFLISKVYRLSETYQMDDQSHLMEKLRTIKNQITISLKALQNSKQLAQLKNNAHMGNFVEYLHQCSDLVARNIRCLFSFTYRCVDIYDLKLGEVLAIDNVMDCTILRALITRLRNEAKKIQEKEEVMLRKIDLGGRLTENNSTVGVNSINGYNNNAIAYQKSLSLQQSTRSVLQPQPLNLNLNGSQVFQLFKKERREKNRSNFPHEPNKKHHMRLGSKESLSPMPMMGNSSVIITRQSEVGAYNFSLPKIAVIHKKKSKR